jgi:hypothetical protein
MAFSTSPRPAAAATSMGLCPALFLAMHDAVQAWGGRGERDDAHRSVSRERVAQHTGSTAD